MWLYLLLSLIIILLLVQTFAAFIAPAQSARRKMMIASWSSPREGNIYGALKLDATNALQYIQKLREETGNHITITHVALKAIGLAIRETPSLNGRIFFGRFIPHKTVDIGCLVALDGGNNLANAKISNVDKRSITNICDTLKEKARTLRDGKDDDFNKTMKLLKFLPVFLIRPIVYIGGFLSSSIGVNIPMLGVKAFPFGSCLVTSVGMMALDLAFVPFTPFARVPLLVMVGSINKEPVVINDQVVVRDMLTLTATLDHRFLDGTQAANLGRRTKEVFENPQDFDFDELGASPSTKKRK
jgi:pyruvate/2-oxoglutarate dehydrogenase complex dihydrolipoamide acyltransferase (E2) component